MKPLVATCSSGGKIVYCKILLSHPSNLPIHAPYDIILQAIIKPLHARRGTRPDHLPSTAGYCYILG